MTNTKVWAKPAIEVTEVRLAKLHTFATTDAQGSLKNANNQPS